MTLARGILRFLTPCGALAPAPVSHGGESIRTEITVGEGPEEIEPEALKEWRKYSDLYKGFIRPLVSSCKVYHHAAVNGREGWDAGSWLAMEFMAPDRRKGWALVVRYPEDRSSTFSFRARGLEAETRYRVAFDNSGRSEHHTGSDLMRTGLSLNLPAEPASELLLFEALE